MRVAGRIAVVLAGIAGAGVVVPPSAAEAGAVPNMPSLIAYVRGGDVFVSKGRGERQVTTGSGWSRPRWSPDGKSLALLRDGQLWAMKADGSGQRRVSTRAASGPSWAPDGKSIAFASLSCTGGPGVYTISATAVDAAPEVVFPASCREEEPPDAPAGTSPGSGSVSDRLRYDDAVAWSPDGSKVAFRGGDCESVYDACLSVGTVATGGERTVAAYGGGGRQNSGFAVVPSWSGDGAKLAWTAYQRGETPAGDQPLHVVEWDSRSGAKQDVGIAQDRELAYVDSARAVTTSTYQNGSWVMVVNVETGARAAFHKGSQPSVQPLT